MDDVKLPTMTGKRLFYLDFIRAISILLIIIFHYNYHALEMGITTNIVFWHQSLFRLDKYFWGLMGVSLFIILSGSSLMVSTKNTFEAKAFFKKRFFSVYPLFWVTYVITYSVLFLRYQTVPVKAHLAAFLLTIAGLDGFLRYELNNFYLLGEWFLGFIIIMYVIFPFLRRLFLTNQLITFLFCVFIMILVERFYCLNMEILRFPPSRLVEFVFGMSFIYFYDPSRGLSKVFLIGIAGIFFFLAVGTNMPSLYRTAIEGICIFICLSCVSSFFDNLFFRKIVTFFSVYSYGAFLIHHILLTQTLPLFRYFQLNLLEDYMLFSFLVIIIYMLSFLLTNLTAFGLRRCRS